MKRLVLLVGLAALASVATASSATASAALFDVGSEQATFKATGTKINTWAYSEPTMGCELPTSNGEIENGGEVLILPLVDQECDSGGEDGNVEYNGCAFVFHPEEVAPHKYEAKMELGDAPGESCSAILVTGWPYESCETTVSELAESQNVSMENVDGEPDKLKIEVYSSLVGESSVGQCDGVISYEAGWLIGAEGPFGPVDISLKGTGGEFPSTEATDFEAQFGGSNEISGVATAGDTPTLAVSTGSMTCEDSLTGTMSGLSAESLSLSLTSGDCLLTKNKSEHATDLISNSCGFDLSVDPESEKATPTGNLDLSCWEENAPEYVVHVSDSESSVLCRYAIKSQVASGISYANTGSGPYGATVKASVSGVRFVMTRLSGTFLNCGSATQEWSYSGGSVTLSAENSGEQSGIRVY